MNDWPVAGAYTHTTQMNIYALRRIRTPDVTNRATADLEVIRASNGTGDV